MPVEVVDLDLTAETGPIAQPTFTDVGVVGIAEESPPEAEFGELNRYSDSTSVADDYGEDSDVHAASQAIAEMGASFWYVLVLEATEHEESVESGEAVDEIPILGEHSVEAETRDVVFSTGQPPETPADGEVAINTDTGTVVSDDGESVELTYHSVDTRGLDVLSDETNRIGLADRRMGVEHIGVLNALVSFASGENMGVVAAGINGNTVADDDTALAEYHDVFSYVPSGDLLAVAHKSSDDVAAHVLGQLATNDPWFDPFYDGDGYPFATDYYDHSLVGDPSTPGTFEGGDVEDEAGNVNVVIQKGGVQVLSNSLTTAGAESNYAFFDVGRTQDFIAAEIRRALTSLRLQQDQIPFTEAGRDQIVNTVRDTVSQYVGGGGPLADYDVTVPPIEELSDADKANRVYSGITIEAVLAGNVHEFGVTLRVTV